MAVRARAKLVAGGIAGILILVAAGAYFVNTAPTIRNLERCIRSSHTISELRVRSEEGGLDRIDSYTQPFSQADWISHVTKNADEIRWKEGRHELPENPVIISMAEFESFWAYVISEEPVGLFIIASEDGEIYGHLLPQE